MQLAVLSDHAGLQGQQARHPPEGHDLQVFPPDDAHRIGGILVDDGLLGLNDQLFHLDAGDGESHLEAVGQAGRHLHLLQGEGVVPDVGGPEGVGAGGNTEDEKMSPGVGRGPHAGVGQEYMGADQGLTRSRVLHRAGDLAGAGPGNRWQPEEGQNQQCSPAMWSLEYHRGTSAL